MMMMIVIMITTYIHIISKCTSFTVDLGATRGRGCWGYGQFVYSKNNNDNDNNDTSADHNDMQ